MIDRTQLEVNTHSPEETRKLGRFIGETAQPGDVILLTGELGAGKTCLTQGIALGLDIEENVMSPSFVLVREMRGRLPLYHIDLYRLDNPAEIENLGLDEYFYGEGVSVIEWADKATGLLPPENILINISYISETDRGIQIKANGQRYILFLDKVRYLIPNL